MTHPQFRIDSLHERSRFLADPFRPTVQLGAPRPRRMLGVFNHRYAHAPTSAR
jgi:hypothetical protein